MKTDSIRLKRELDSGHSRPRIRESRRGIAKAAPSRSAVLYFENLSGVKEDEYLRDGITEDIITELSKIRGLKTYPRLPCSRFATSRSSGADWAATARRVRLDRESAPIRENAADHHAARGYADRLSPCGRERYDREMKDVFEVQDEIARKIAEALRVTLSPQELEALA